MEQDIENWKKQQMLLGNKAAAILGTGSLNLNQLLYSGSGSAANNQSYGASMGVNQGQFTGTGTAAGASGVTGASGQQNQAAAAFAG